MDKLYMGLDFGSKYTKGVIIDEHNKIIANNIIDSNDNIDMVVDKITNELFEQVKNMDYELVSIGVTGYYRDRVRNKIDYNVSINEIVSLSVGALSIDKDIKKIIDVGARDTKIISFNKNGISDYDIIYTGLSDYIDLFKNIDIFNIDKMDDTVLIGGYSKNKDINNKILNNVNKLKLLEYSKILGAMGVAIISKKIDNNMFYNVEEYGKNKKKKFSKYLIN